MIRGLLFKYGFFFILVLVSLAGCGPSVTGIVKDDVTLTDETKKLVEAGLKYRGPVYNIAIIGFDVPKEGWRDLGNSASTMLWTMLKQSGLEPIYMTKEALRKRARLLQLEQSGMLKRGWRSTSHALESVDYSISGTITSYSEVEESTDILIAKTKTRVARVQVDYGLIDVGTGKSLLVESGMGEYRKTTGGVLGFGSKSTADPALRDGALRDALTKAMNKMIEKLNAQEFVSNVLAVEGGKIYVRAGVKSRFGSGTVFEVFRPGEKLVDPETGRVIGRRQRRIAELVITKHQSDRVSITKVKSFKEGEVIRAGDVIKLLK